MLQIRRYQIQGEFSNSVGSALISGLKGTFTPLVTSIRQGYWSKLGLAPEDPAHAPRNPEAYAGELYLTQSGDFFYFKIAENRHSLECGGIFKSGDPAGFTPFLDSLKTIIRPETKGKEPGWEPLTQEEKFSSFASKRSLLKPSKQEVAAAAVLEDPNLHRFLARMQNSPSTLLRDLLSSDDRQRIESLADSLVNAHLLTKDFVVLCKEKGEQIVKVNSRQAIHETSEKGLKCFLCGKPISEETVEETLSMTDLGRKMMENNHWMPVRMLDLLGKLGVKDSAVVVDEEGDLLTIYFLDAGEIVAIALFNHKLSINDAYILNAKLSLSEAKTVILLGLNGVSPLMSEFLQESNPGRLFHVFESMSGFPEKLKELLDLRQQEKVQELLAPFNLLTTVPLHELVCEKLFAGGDLGKASAQTGPMKRGRTKEESLPEKADKV